MDESSGNDDIISHLPCNVIDTILINLPIKEAVRTSILSRKWRYQWSTMTQLEFDESCVSHSDKRKVTKERIVNFITRCLLLHEGPIKKFKICNLPLKMSPDIDQWLLFLSRKDIKELYLHADDHQWVKHQRSYAPRIYSCHKLTSLTLYEFIVKPPPEFQGFQCLKYLELTFVTITREALENLISSCPLLESFALNHLDDNIALTVRAPSLKHLTLEGILSDLFLEHTPHLVDMSICFFTEEWKGDILAKVPVTYECLKFITIEGFPFKDMYAVWFLHHLILHSPNLQELQIADSKYRYNNNKTAWNFWEKESPAEFKFKQLKVVTMLEAYTKICIEFIKFVLGRSPVLEVMNIVPDTDYSRKMEMVNNVLHFPQASPKVDIKFYDEPSLCLSKYTLF